jgi:hypothetical protein
MFQWIRVGVPVGVITRLVGFSPSTPAIHKADTIVADGKVEDVRLNQSKMTARSSSFVAECFPGRVTRAFGRNGG